jgi:hypothetical protein
MIRLSPKHERGSGGSYTFWTVRFPKDSDARTSFVIARWLSPISDQNQGSPVSEGTPKDVIRRLSYITQIPVICRF